MLRPLPTNGSSEGDIDQFLIDDETIVDDTSAGDGAPALRGITFQITALMFFLTPEQQSELMELRTRDWVTENVDAEIQSARNSCRPPRKTEIIRRAGVPSPADTVDVKTPSPADHDAKRLILERDARIAALSASVPDTWYAAPDEADIYREEQVLKILHSKFTEWQEKGYIPSAIIEPGDKTEEPIRTRGYTHWHHLFNPRQLLTLGLFAFFSDEMKFKGAAGAGCVLALGKISDWNSRLCRFLLSLS